MSIKKRKNYKILLKKLYINLIVSWKFEIQVAVNGQ